MIVNDVLGDLFTRIRNSYNVRFLYLPYKASKMCLAILDVLKKEGYIKGYDYITSPIIKNSDLSTKLNSIDKINKNIINTQSTNIINNSLTSESIIIHLKYIEGKPVISNIKRISRPGRRVYVPIKDLPKAYNGLGIYILSTSKGILSDKQARMCNVGGEVLCKIL